jgi:hypothetical protein
MRWFTPEPNTPFKPYFSIHILLRILCGLLLISASFSASAQSWTQLGQDRYGAAPGDPAWFGVDRYSAGDCFVINANITKGNRINIEQIPDLEFSTSPLSAPGNCLHFDGSNDYVEVVNSPLIGDTDYSVEAWFLTEKAGDQLYSRLVGWDNFELDIAIRFDELWFDADFGWINTNVNVNDGLWHHAAITRSGNTYKMYVDGILTNALSNGGVRNFTGLKFRIGGKAVGGNLPFTLWEGKIDEFRIWDRALTLAEILNSKDCELDGTEPNLVGYWNFNQGNAGADNTGLTSLDDLSANSNDGTLFNFGLTGNTSNWIASGAGLSGACVPPCPPGNLALTTQTAIDNFPTDYPGCTTISGTLTINDDGTDPITNLNGLAQLTTITSTLAILNTSLPDLTGLDGVSSVGQSMVLNNNGLLTTLTGLEALTSIGGNFLINSNPSLQDLQGLDNLTSIGNGLSIVFNPQLADLTALSNLTTLGFNNVSTKGPMVVVNNDALLSLSGLESIDPNTVATLNLANCDLLTTCEIQSICDYLDIPANPANISGNGVGCESRTTVENACSPNPPCLPSNVLFSTQAEIDAFPTTYPTCLDIIGNLIIAENPGAGDPILNLNGLAQVVTVGGNLIIQNNPNLTGLSGLDGLQSIGGDLTIRNNLALTQIDALSGINSVPGDLYLLDNPILSSIIGLSGLTSIGEGLRISKIDALLDLTGLESLTSIGGELWLFNNDALQSLTHLSSLTSINGELRLANNDALTSLSGVDNIDPNTITFLLIQASQVLSTCNVQSICDYLTLNLGPANISGNATDCNSEAEIETACTPPTGLPVTYDNNPATQTGSNINIETLSGFVVPAGSDRILIVSLAFTQSSNSGVTSISYNGGLLTEGVTVNQDFGGVTYPFSTIWYLELGSGPAITSDILVQFAANCNISHVNAASYHNVDQLVPIGNTGTSVGDGSSTSIVINTSAQNGVVDNLLSGGGAPITVGSDQIEVYNSTNGNVGGGSFEQAVSSTVTMSWSKPATSYTHAAMELNKCSSCTLYNSPCLPGGITFSSQTEIDDFIANYPSCTEILGDVTIEEAIPGTITNLLGLSSLQGIGGNLSIQNNSALANLTGLDNLDAVDGNLLIDNNAALLDLAGLGNASTSFGGSIELQNNALLSTIVDLNFPSIVNGLVTIDANPELLNLTGMESITEISDALIISYNNKVNDLTGLTNLLSIGAGFDLISNGNTGFTDLSGLGNLQSIGCEFVILNMPYLQSLAGLSSLTAIGQGGSCTKSGITINGAAFLSDINPISNVTQFQGHIWIINTNLTDLSAFENYDPNSIGPFGLSVGLNLGLNNLLTVCSASAICDYLSDPANTAVIGSNGAGCNTRPEVETDCIPAPGPCLPGGITFTTQAQIDAFPTDYPSCNQILGDVKIKGADITNLDGLSQITAIDGFLQINTNPVLTNVNGLSALQSVGGYLHFLNNASLANVDGLSALQSVGGALQFRNNNMLSNLTGIENIDHTTITFLILKDNPLLSACEVQSICDYLAVPANSAIISGNATGCSTRTEVETACIAPPLPCLPGGIVFNSQVEINNFPTLYPGCTEIQGNVEINGVDISNLDGLNQINIIGGSLNLNNNPNLTDISGLNNLQTVGNELNLNSNPGILDLDGFASLTTVGGNFDIRNIDALTQVDGLSLLTSVGGRLKIDDNNVLTNINGLSALTTIGGSLQLFNNDALASFTGLDNVSSIGGSLTIEGNDAITDLTGLGALTSIGNRLSIEDNDDLTSLEGLNALTSIGESILFRELILLNNVNALSNLTTINGFIIIEDNDVLTSLTGLDNIDANTIVDDVSQPGVSINNNPFLAVCDVQSICDYLGDPANSASISGNATGCGSRVEVETACIPPPVPCLTGGITFSTQAQIDAFSTDYPGCTQIQGDVLIQGADITNLNGLSPIVSIVGMLEIQTNPNLADVSGLSNLTTLSGLLRVEGNNILVDLSGLDAIDPTTITDLILVNNPLLSVCEVQSICDYLDVPSNPATISGNATGCSTRTEVETACIPPPVPCLAGGITFNTQGEIDNFPTLYPGCAEILGDVYINGADITNLNGLSQITAIGGFLQIVNNPILTDMSGLNNLQTVGTDVNLLGNSSLLDLDGLAALSSVGGNFDMRNNDSVTQVDGLSSLTSVGGRLKLDDNNALANINGLSGLTSIGGSLQIFANNALTSLSGLDFLTTIGGSLSIQDNGTITNLIGLGALTSIGNRFTLEGNNNLLNVDGLNALTSIGEALWISGDNQLSNVNALSNLTSINGFILIEDNNALTSLSGLDNIDASTIVDDVSQPGVTITNNPLLAVCEVQSICDYLSNQANSSNISGNATGCSTRTEVETACIPPPVPCLPGGITLNTQGQIDAFPTDYPGCNEIIGSLSIISGADITNLDGLSQLISIGDNLNIINNPNLTDITGLSNLQSVGGNLNFDSNPALPNLDGLNSLTSVGGDLKIVYGLFSNTALLNVDGLSSLTSIGGYLLISNQDNLIDLDGLSLLTTIGERLEITDNTSLLDLDGLSSLVSMNGFLRIENNASLTSISGLGSLTNVGEYIEIINNNSLISLTGLDNIDPSTIMGDNTNAGIQIFDNNSLSICDVQGICDYLAGPMNYASIINNAPGCDSKIEVETACLPPTVTCLAGGITFSSQSQVDNFAAMYPGCNEILGDVLIQGADITNLDGIIQISSINGNLELVSNPSLTNINGFLGLNTISGTLWIEANTQLPDISGLQLLDPSSITDLVILNNSQLSVCDVLSICDYLEDQNNTATISGNASSCNTRSEIEIACTPIPGPCLSGGIDFASQDQIDDFPINYPGCTEVQGNLRVIFGADITNLDGLSQLITIGGSLDIIGNPNLTDITGLSNLQSVGGNLNFDSNPALPNLDGLNSLTSVGGDLKIVYGLFSNTALLNVDGLSSLTSIGGYLLISNQDNLIDLDGLSLLTTIGERLEIKDNSKLLNLDGLSSLSFINGNLILENNFDLNSISGLNSMASVAGYIKILNNNSLPSLNGLENIDPGTIMGDNFNAGLQISNNNILAVCDVQSICDYLDDPNNSASISNNAPGCSSQLEVETACTPPLSPCLSGGITLSTQIQIDDFPTDYPGCTQIQGNVLIQGADIINLNGLSQLASIAGNLEISSNPILTDLTGLNNLASIAGTLTIESNAILMNLSGLESIDPSSITDLSILNNSQLTLCEVQSICDYLADQNNTATISGNASGCITRMEVETACIPVPGPCLPGGINFTSQSQIDNFPANYPGCNEILGNLKIIAGADITNLDGLSQLITIGGNLDFIGNPNLTDITGLSNLQSVGGNLNFDSNPALPNLDGLNSLTSVGGDLKIVYGLFSNTALLNVDGLSSLTSIGGYLLIRNQDNLVDLDGLSLLATIGGRLEITDNTSLLDLDGLSSLVSMNGFLRIENNASLTSISGLGSLTTVGEYIKIINNNNLSSLTGLDNIDPLTIVGDITNAGLQIFNNPLLAICDVQSICDYLSDPLNSAAIINNAPGCNSQPEVEAACTSNLVQGEVRELVDVVAEQVERSFTLIPNPTSEEVTIDLADYLGQSIELSILHPTGKQIWSYREEDLAMGELTLQLQDIGIYMDGTYYVILRSDGAVITKRMVVVR